MHCQHMVHPEGGCIGNRGDCEVQGIPTPYMDPSCEGSQASMVEDAILHDQGGGGVDHQILACAVATTNKKPTTRIGTMHPSKPKDTTEARSSS
jgi:hypothetical protein